MIQMDNFNRLQLSWGQRGSSWGMVEADRSQAVHIDQGLRGVLFHKEKSNMFSKSGRQYLDGYKNQAILPMSLLECAGINTKEVFQGAQVAFYPDQVNLSQIVAYMNQLREDLLSSSDYDKRLPPIYQMPRYFIKRTAKKIKTIFPENMIRNKLKDQKQRLTKFGIQYIKNVSSCCLKCTRPLLTSCVGTDLFSCRTLGFKGRLNIKLKKPTAISRSQGS